MNDFFNGNDFLNMKLDDDLVERVILSARLYNNPRTMEFSYEVLTDLDDQKVIKDVSIPVLEFPYPTMDQLDDKVRMDWDLETLTHVKGYVIVNYGRHWKEIYQQKGNAPTASDNKSEELNELEILSVSESLRKHSGTFGVRGTITSLTKLFKMISGFREHCDNCNESNEIVLPEPVYSIKFDRKCPNPDCENQILIKSDYNYCNAVNVELQDLEQFNDLERLPVLLFDKDTEKIRVGENIIVKGQIRVDSSTGKARKLFPCFYAKSIQYDKNDKITLTQLDIDAIKRFTYKHGSKIIDKLASMFDPSIIGYEHVKTGLLLSAVNSNADNNNFNKRRERIHSLSIGTTGLAKSKILRSGTRLIPYSRYESGGRNSSGRSLTAIVSKEEENYTLRVGPIPLAKNAICAINEFGRTDFEDQAHFLDVMEEGEFTINKYGINARIRATTTIIASANPINNSTWLDDETIDLNEIPALKPIIDRFDLIFVFRPRKTEDEIRDYAYRKSSFESNKIPDYSNYVVKHLEYAKRFNPVISDEGQQMLSEYFIKIMLQDINFGSNRTLDTLLRLSKAFARLKLKNVVDADDARETIEFYNVVLQQYQRVISIPLNPRDVTYNECLKILRENQVAITLGELLKQACHNNHYIERYLCFSSKSLRLQENAKVKSVYAMLLNHTNVRRIQEKPVVLQWVI